MPWNWSWDPRVTEAFKRGLSQPNRRVVHRRRREALRASQYHLLSPLYVMQTPSAVPSGIGVWGELHPTLTSSLPSHMFLLLILQACSFPWHLLPLQHIVCRWLSIQFLLSLTPQPPSVFPSLQATVSAAEWWQLPSHSTAHWRQGAAIHPSARQQTPPLQSHCD